MLNCGYAKPLEPLAGGDIRLLGFTTPPSMLCRRRREKGIRVGIFFRTDREIAERRRCHMQRSLILESLEIRRLLDGDGFEVTPSFDDGTVIHSTSTELLAAAASAFVATEVSDTPPILHSLPDATAKVFLDFDGNFEPSWGGNTNVLTPAFDLDGNPDQFNIEEQNRIYEAWVRVSEDFAPFQVDVTTEDPSDAATPLRQATMIGDRTRTFYFRHRFDVVDAADVAELTISMIRDDGAAVYLNGVEVVRDNLAPDAAFDDFATATVSGNDESTLHRFTVDPSLLVDGENVLAVEVHQRSDTSSDVSFDLRLDGLQSGNSEEWVSLGSAWNYLDDGSDQGQAWRDPEFDDGDWSDGTGEFGYGDSDETTTLQIRPSGQGRTRTFYFRNEFEVSDPSDFEQLDLGLLRDDGAAVYLNGEEVVRDNLRANAQYDDFASGTVGGDDESTYFPFELDVSLLRAGRNVLAVEVHQASDTSSDVSFDLELAGTGPAGDRTELITKNATWRYLDDGSDQQTLWRETDFDDASWPRGQGQFGYGDATATVHVAIGPEDWFEDSAGGVAFVGSYSPNGRAVVYTFTNGFGPSGKNIAEVSSHEAGHAFGLGHQSVYDPDTGEKTQEYNPGSGDWAPIMGNSYSPALTTWNEGPTGSNARPQDDMARIARAANGFGYRDDDYGNSSADAVSLITEDRFTFEHSGIVERNDDQDAFAFAIAEGQQGITLEVVGAEFGANLDAVLEIRDANDQVVASDDPSSRYDAELSVALDPGDYTAMVRSNGQYGRVGQYTLSGQIDEPTQVLALDSLAPLANNAALSERLTATVNFSDDVDTFAVAVRAGDALTAIVTPTERSRLTVSVPGLADPIVGARGRSVVIPLVAVGDDESQLIEVSGDRQTDYTIQIGRNVVFEGVDSDAENPVAIQAATATNAFWPVFGQSELTVDTVNLVGPTASWKYWDNGNQPGGLVAGTDWYDVDFNDGGWQEGRGEFGYGDNDETTLLDRVDGDGQRIRTFYFRQTFDLGLEDLAGMEGLTLDIKFDDGMAAYLNGTEIARSNLAANAGHGDFASGTISNEGTYRTFTIPIDMLQAGSNVLAIEVHQASDTSSDVSLDARLTVGQRRAAIDAYAFEVLSADAGQPLDILLRGQGVDFRQQGLEVLDENGQVLAVGLAASNNAAQDLELLDWTPTVAGSYRVRLTSSAIGDYVLSINSGRILQPGDANQDGIVDFADFLILSGAFGTQGSWESGDFDSDGLVGFSDFLILSASFGM